MVKKLIPINIDVWIIGYQHTSTNNAGLVPPVIVIQSKEGAAKAYCMPVSFLLWKTSNMKIIHKTEDL